jgi:amino acid transporter
VVLNRSPRPLNTIDAVALTIGTMVGAGIFSILSLTVKTAGPAAVLSWVLVVLLSLPMAFTFSDLTGVLSESGGPYVYLRTQTRPWVGLWVGWAFLVSSVGAAAALFIALVGMLRELDSPHAYLVGVLILIGLTVVTALGVHVGASVQRILTLSTVFLLLLCIVIGLLHMRGWGGIQFASSAPEVGHSVHTRLAKLAPHGWWATLPATFFAFWTYSGWEAVAAPSGAYASRKALAKGMLIGSFLVGFLYILVAAAAVAAVPSGEIATHLNPMVLLGALWSPAVGALIGWGAVVIVIGSLLAWLIASSALAQALMRDGLLPGGRLSNHRGEYHVSLPIGVAVLLALLAKLPVFSLLIAASSMTALVAYAVVFASVALDKHAMWDGFIRTPRQRRLLAVLSFSMALTLVACSGWANIWPTLLLLAAGGVLILSRYFRGKIQLQSRSKSLLD